jgi:hypothetical protein
MQSAAHAPSDELRLVPENGPLIMVVTPAFATVVVEAAGHNDTGAGGVSDSVRERDRILRMLGGIDADKYRVHGHPLNEVFARPVKFVGSLSSRPTS